MCACRRSRPRSSILHGLVRLPVLGTVATVPGGHPLERTVPDLEAGRYVGTAQVALGQSFTIPLEEDGHLINVLPISISN